MQKNKLRKIILLEIEKLFNDNDDKLHAVKLNNILPELPIIKEEYVQKNIEEIRKICDSMNEGIKMLDLRNPFISEQK